MRSRTYLEVERERLLLEKKKKQKAKDIKGKGRASKDENDREEDYPSSDRLRSAKSLMKHAILHSGSRDTSAILFTALCRALDVPARLVVSLQSIPWSAKSEKMKWSDLDDLRAEVNGTDAVSDPPASASTSTPTTGGKGKGKVTTAEKGKGKEKVVKLRRGRSHDRRSRPAHPTPNDENSPPLEGYPPVVWTEVYSRPEGKWIPVDCVRYLVDKRKLFEPPEGSRVNRMGYVVAWEEGECCLFWLFIWFFWRERNG
jgi:xeroderma pigmentosum group C-complementing protein